MTMRINADLSGLNNLLSEFESKVNGAVRPSAQSAAQVIYDEVKRNVAQIGRITGNLERSIYQVYSKKRSGESKATYEVSYNRQKAPHGHLIEYGHIQKFKRYVGSDGKWYTKKDSPIPPKQVGARPFIRPAITKFNLAMDAAKDKMIEMLNKDYT